MFREKKKEIGLNFIPWVTHDKKTGNWNGVRDDAPEDIKQEYEQWKERQAEYKRLGIKV